LITENSKIAVIKKVSPFAPSIGEKVPGGRMRGGPKIILIIKYNTVTLQK